MVKVLRFENDTVSQDRFSFLYAGLCQSTKTHGPRDLQTLQREGDLRKKFDAVSQPREKSGERFKFVNRDLTAMPVEILVSQDDLQMLKDYVPATIWSPMVSDIVADAVAWAWGAPELKAEPANPDAPKVP